MKRLAVLTVVASLLLGGPASFAFCGFYVAKADTKIFNRASRVAIVRHDDRTVITMANDFRGDPEEFAIVIPVPTFITRDQIHVADNALLDHLDAYTAPRLVEYFDADPCMLAMPRPEMKRLSALGYAGDREAEETAGLGVTVEARYTVGEYDIVLLSATQSDGLLTFLRRGGYRLPDGAEPILGSYLRQGMRFFLARVNLKQQARLGYTYLRPIQVAFESPKFVLPIRLGTLNADGAQELFVYALTRKGRVETTNYRTVKLPTGMDVPVFVKGEFPEFYRDLFAHQVQRENRRAVFLEYAWNMGWCDPCAADPLDRDELRELGVFWLDGESPGRGGAQEVYVTRLHVRYDAARFPEDLVFQETGDSSNFQGRYVLRHAWNGDATCDAATAYRRELVGRREREAQTLAKLTGRDIDAIRERMRRDGVSFGAPDEDDRPWWKRIWDR